mmetsp:Transcript_39317/g.105509  ORF Transcript_39317/g.105509 Transcript_39317/m.105509 type:complete len:243 (+) Transcript_39317:190-918(+)
MTPLRPADHRNGRSLPPAILLTAPRLAGLEAGPGQERPPHRLLLGPEDAVLHADEVAVGPRRRALRMRRQVARVLTPSAQTLRAPEMLLPVQPEIMVRPALNFFPLGTVSLNVYLWALLLHHSLQPVHHRHNSHQSISRLIPTVPTLDSLYHTLHHLAAALCRENGVQNLTILRKCTHERCILVYHVRERNAELHVQIRVKSTLERNHRRSTNVASVSPVFLVDVRGVQVGSEIGSNEVTAI